MMYSNGVIMLVRCPECGKYISERAEACPQCGMVVTPERIEGTARVQAEDLRHRARLKVCNWVGGIGLGFFLLTLITGAWITLRGIEQEGDRQFNRCLDQMEKQIEELKEDD
jgi:ribosomal protein L32